jgi:hypothetical protein
MAEAAQRRRLDAHKSKKVKKLLKKILLRYIYFFYYTKQAIQRMKHSASFECCRYKKRDSAGKPFFNDTILERFEFFGSKGGGEKREPAFLRALEPVESDFGKILCHSFDLNRLIFFDDFFPKICSATGCWTRRR